MAKGAFFALLATLAILFMAVAPAVALTAEDAKTILDNFAKKVNADVNLSQCQTDVSGSIQAIEGFIANLKLDEAHIKTAMNDISQALQSFSSALTDCGFSSLGSEVAHIVTEMQHGIWAIEQDVDYALEGLSIYNEAQQAWASCAAGNLISCGADIGDIANKLSNVSPNSTWHIFVNFARILGADITDLGHCKNDLSTVHTDIQSFLAHIHLDEADIKIALHSLQSLLGDFSQGLKDCSAPLESVQRVEKIVAMLQNSIVAIESGVSIAIEGVQVFDQSMKTFHDCSAMKFNDAASFAACGADFGNLANMLPQKANSTWHLFVDFARSLGTDIDDIGMCVGDVDQAHDAVVDMIKHMKMDENDIKIVLTDLNSALSSFSSGLKDCGLESASARVSAIVSRMKSGFWDVEQGITIALDGIKLYDRFEDAFKQCSSEDMLLCGDALANIILSIPNEPAVAVFEAVIKRLAKEVLDVSACLDDVKGTVTNLEVFGQNLKLKEKDIRVALHALATSAADFADALKDCDVMELGEAFAKFAAKLESGLFVFEEAIKIVVDGIDIYDDIKAFHSDYVAHDYFDAGFKLADAAKKIFSIL